MLMSRMCAQVSHDLQTSLFDHLAVFGDGTRREMERGSADGNGPNHFPSVIGDMRSHAAQAEGDFPELTA